MAASNQGSLKNGNAEDAVRQDTGKWNYNRQKQSKMFLHSILTTQQPSCSALWNIRLLGERQQHSTSWHLGRGCQKFWTVAPALSMPASLLGGSLDLFMPQASPMTIRFIFLEVQSKALSIDIYKAVRDLQTKDPNKASWLQTNSFPSVPNTVRYDYCLCDNTTCLRVTGSPVLQGLPGSPKHLVLGGLRWFSILHPRGQPGASA